MGKKISFPLGDGKVKNGYFDPTSIPSKIQAKKMLQLQQLECVWQHGVLK